MCDNDMIAERLSWRKRSARIYQFPKKFSCIASPFLRHGTGPASCFWQRRFYATVFAEIQIFPTLLSGILLLLQYYYSHHTTTYFKSVTSWFSWFAHNNETCRNSVGDMGGNSQQSRARMSDADCMNSSYSAMMEGKKQRRSELERPFKGI